MLTIKAIERGWFAETGAHSAQHRNTATGIAGDLGILRAFIVFELPRFTEPLTRASLHLELEAYLSGDELETFTINGVGTPARAMGMTYRPGAAAGQAIFAELGAGVEYGRATVTAKDVGCILEIALSDEAIEDMQKASGALFTIGIQLDQSEPPQADNDALRIVRFSAASEDRTHHLVLETGAKLVVQPTQSREFGLQYEVSETEMSDTLRQIISTQATTLEIMLQSLLDSVVQAQEKGQLTHTNTTVSMRELIQRTCDQLTLFAANHVRVEQRIGEALTGTNHNVELSTDCVTLLNDLEVVNTVLHGNIAVARRYLEMMREQYGPAADDVDEPYDTDDTDEPYDIDDF